MFRTFSLHHQGLLFHHRNKFSRPLSFALYMFLQMAHGMLMDSVIIYMPTNTRLDHCKIIFMVMLLYLLSYLLQSLRLLRCRELQLHLIRWSLLQLHHCLHQLCRHRPHLRLLRLYPKLNHPWFPHHLVLLLHPYPQLCVFRNYPVQIFQKGLRCANGRECFVKVGSTTVQ